MSEEITNTTSTEKSTDAWSFGAELLRTVLVIGILAFVIRYFIVQPFIVEGESMSPYFHTNDYLLVDKLSYRFHAPERGDVIVFRYPNDPSINYVKRVIGLPGETVTIKNGSVSIANTTTPNGFKLNETYLPVGLQTQLLNGSSDGVFIIPSDDFFVLGDNRPNSSDSREWGWMPKSDLIGRVAVEALPLNQARLIRHINYAS